MRLSPRPSLSRQLPARNRERSPSITGFSEVVDTATRTTPQEAFHTRASTRRFPWPPASMHMLSLQVLR